MAITAMTGLVPEWFTPAQPESDRVSRLLLKPLNGIEHLSVQNELAAHRITEAQRIALKTGIVDWEQFDDKAGNPLPFSRENIDLLPVSVLAEASMRIISISRMGDATAKN